MVIDSQLLTLPQSLSYCEAYISSSSLVSRPPLLPPPSISMSSSSTTACSRSPSPATPEASDTLDPAVSQDVVNAWCQSLSPDPFVGADVQYGSPDKEGTPASLELDDLIQDDAYEECAAPFASSKLRADFRSLFPVCTASQLDPLAPGHVSFVLQSPFTVLFLPSICGNGRRTSTTRAHRIHQAYAAAAAVPASTRPTTRLTTICCIPCKGSMLKVGSLDYCPAPSHLSCSPAACPSCFRVYQKAARSRVLRHKSA